MKSWRLFLPLLLFVMIPVVLLVQLLRDAGKTEPRQAESALIGLPVPEFRLPLLKIDGMSDGNDILPAGKPVLLNIWATWCPTCRAEHAFLEQLAARGIPIIGVDYKDNRRDALDWLQALGDPYWRSLFDREGALGLDLGVYGAPETFLVDGHGVIRYRYAGELTPDVWEHEIRPLWQKYSGGRGQ